MYVPLASFRMKHTVYKVYVKVIMFIHVGQALVYKCGELSRQMKLLLFII